MRSISGSKFSVESPPPTAHGVATLVLSEVRDEPRARTYPEDLQIPRRSGPRRSAVPPGGISAGWLPRDRPEHHSTSKRNDHREPSISEIPLWAYSGHRALRRGAHEPSRLIPDALPVRQCRRNVNGFRTRAIWNQ